MELPLTHEFRGRGRNCRQELTSMIHRFCVISLFLIGHVVWALNPHPRIWLDTAHLNAVRAKACLNPDGSSISPCALDADWVSLKKQADTYKTLVSQAMTITAASNSNPVSFTITQTVPWNTAATLFLGGATGSWTSVNATAGLGWTATKTGTHTFTIPIDSSGFGSFSGQSLGTFVKVGTLSGYFGYDYEGLPWAATIPTLALTAQVLGDSSYCAPVVSWLNYLNTAGAAGITTPESADSGWPSRTVLLSMGLAYDWCYSSLNSDQKTATATTVNLFYNWMKANAYGLTQGNGGGAYSNYWGGHILGTSLAAYATFDENTNAPAMLTWVSDQWTTNSYNNIARTFSAPVPGIINYYDTTGFYNAGIPWEWNYGAAHIKRLLQYMLAAKTAGGTDMFQTTDYARRWAASNIYELKPDRWSVRTDGIWSANVTGVYHGELPIILSDILAGTTEGGWMQQIITHFGTPPADGYSPGILTGLDTVSNPMALLERCIFYGPNRSATDYRQTQPNYWFANDSSPRVNWRSDWTDSALWLMFHAGTQNLTGGTTDSGGIEISKGSDKLIANSQNWKGTGDGTSDTPQVFPNSGGCSSMVSTLHFNDGGAYIKAPEGVCAPYDGGQGIWGKYVAPSYALASDHAFVFSDLTNAYEMPAYNPATRSLRYFYRAVASMGDGAVIVWRSEERRVGKECRSRWS